MPSPPHGQEDQKTPTVTIQDAHSKFEEYSSAVAAVRHPFSNTGDVSETLLSFLEVPQLAPYYKLETNFALSQLDEQGETFENMSACRQYLRRAEGSPKESSWVPQAPLLSGAKEKQVWQ
ncbi:hypothetical protein B0A55_02147 [Friedmanniomyces simplex]|uniref:Uncharacterized protein n=1 Tax=Friedmanniomyces simplex TaxID=329884 RepID=A0A4U0XY09_9PEZI|nr:hypothetical protein B0A55_02147 [Friedmanniomyces simplex]